MPTEEQLEVIKRVIDRVSGRYKFSYYTEEDIKQEAFILCLEALESYDSSRPLENFIAVHLSNRLKTLRRNKYHRQNLVEGTNHFKLNEAKRSLMDLKSISGPEETDQEFKEASYEIDFDGKLSSQEALEKVFEQLTPEMRKDFHRLVNGASVKNHRKTALYDRVKEILGEDW